MGNAKLQYVQGRPIFTNINEHKNQYPYLNKKYRYRCVYNRRRYYRCYNVILFFKREYKLCIIEKRRIAHLSTSVTTSLLQYELDDNLSDFTEYIDLEDAI